MKILIIGSSGFIGSKMLEHCKLCGYEVFGISRLSGKSLLQTLKEKFIEKDFHLAINAAGVSNNNKPAKDYLTGNINIACDITSFFDETKVPVINISAACIYNNSTGLNITESSNIINPNAYSISKLGSEEVFNEAKHPVLNLRLPAVIGKEAPTSWPVRLLNNKKNGIKNLIFNADNLYNHVMHINNLSEFVISQNIARLIREKHTVNLCSDQPIMFSNAAKILLETEPFEEERSHNLGFTLSNELAKRSYGFKPWTVECALETFKKEFYE